MIKGNEGTTVHTFPFLSFYRHQIPDPYSSEKVAKKSKVHLFLSQKGIDLLEHETMVSAFYTLSLSLSLSFWMISLWSCLVTDVLSTCFLPSVSVVPKSSVHRLLLRRPSIFPQNLRLRGQTSCSRHLPLLPVPEQEVCESLYILIKYWNPLILF